MKNSFLRSTYIFEHSYRHAIVSGIYNMGHLSTGNFVMFVDLYDLGTRNSFLGLK